MSAWPVRYTPKTLRYCPLCGRETPHEIREIAEVTICLKCLERALSYELDRE